MVGIGKTTLAVSIAEQLQDEFEYVFWRSLRNASPIEDFLTELILFLFERQELNLPKTLEDQMSYLIKFLRQHRCLLVLDNIESIFCSNELAGRYRSGYKLYGQLLRRLGDEPHQSCIILTSQEKPFGFKAKEGKTLPVRSLYLRNLQLGRCCINVEAELNRQSKLVSINKQSNHQVMHSNRLGKTNCFSS